MKMVFLSMATNSKTNVSYIIKTQNEGSMPKTVTQEKINAILI